MLLKKIEYSLQLGFYDVYLISWPSMMVHTMEASQHLAWSSLQQPRPPAGAVYEQNIQLAALRRRAQWQEAIGILRAMSRLVSSVFLLP